MDSRRDKTLVAILVVFMVILVDQLTKILVKTNMSLYDTINITDWFQIYFVENNGMAFGIEAGGKLFLSLFRIIAVVFIIIYIKKIN
jgi:signal peptidase II